MIRRYKLGAGRRIKFALSHPGYSLQALLRELRSADERFLARVAGVPWQQIRAYIDEPVQDAEFMAYLRSHDREFSDLRVSSAELFAKKILLQYALIRALTPECIVETGIANGVSSLYFLYALKRNGTGVLHSVGVDDVTYVPPGRSVGWLVPQDLRRRWFPLLGTSQEVLPGLLEELGQVDVFIHDSLHTYDHMKFEFQLAYPFLKPSGVLISDDAGWNEAFSEFASTSGATLYDIIRGVGVLKKPPSSIAS